MRKVRYYPIFLRVADRRCAVVGGGEVAERKVASLLAAGACVTVISPALTTGLAARVEAGEIAYLARSYRPGDLCGAFLAYAATDDEALNERIWRDAEQAGVLIDVVDRPQWCTFIAPSVMRRGDLTVAVSTGGGSPALARRVRQDIEASLGPEYERALVVLSRLREHLRGRALPGPQRKRIFAALLGSNLLERLRAPDTVAVDRLLASHVGAGVSLETLGAHFQ